MPIPTEVSALLTEMLKDFGGVEERPPSTRKLRSELSLRSRASAGNWQSSVAPFAALSRKWLPTFESRARRLPRAFLLADRAPQLANFVAPALADPSAELELPGEQLDGKPVQHWVKVHSVLPSVRVLLRNGCAVRCVQLRGTNGRVYSYLLEQDSASSATPPPALACVARKASVGHLTRIITGSLAKDEGASQALLQGRCASKCRPNLAAAPDSTEDPSGRPLSLHRMPQPGRQPGPEAGQAARPLAARSSLSDNSCSAAGSRPGFELAGPSEFLHPLVRRVVTPAAGAAGAAGDDAGLAEKLARTPPASLVLGPFAAPPGPFASQAADSQPPTRRPPCIASARCLVLAQIPAWPPICRCVFKRRKVILTYPTGKARGALSRSLTPSRAVMSGQRRVGQFLAHAYRRLAAFEGAAKIRTSASSLASMSWCSGAATCGLIVRADKTLRHLKHGFQPVPPFGRLAPLFLRCLARENGFERISPTHYRADEREDSSRDGKEFQRRLNHGYPCCYCPMAATGWVHHHVRRAKHTACCQLHRDIQV
uniref:Protein kinase domain-containing protein n=1 Tax=Macrostomum lignano TaxID=282301 RepID=A0A1I8FRI9_9PLAT